MYSYIDIYIMYSGGGVSRTISGPVSPYFISVIYLKEKSYARVERVPNFFTHQVAARIRRRFKGEKEGPTKIQVCPAGVLWLLLLKGDIGENEGITQKREKGSLLCISKERKKRDLTNLSALLPFSPPSCQTWKTVFLLCVLSGVVKPSAICMFCCSFK